MEQPQEASSRKKFLLWGAAIISTFTALKLFTGAAKSQNEPVNKTVKMLTQDGKLVEIDKKVLASSGTKISNEELQKWIYK